MIFFPCCWSSLAYYSKECTFFLFFQRCLIWKMAVFEDWDCGWLNSVLGLGLSQGRQLNMHMPCYNNYIYIYIMWSINHQMSVCLSEVFLCQQRMRRHSWWCLVVTGHGWHHLHNCSPTPWNPCFFQGAFFSLFMPIVPLAIHTETIFMSYLSLLLNSQAHLVL